MSKNYIKITTLEWFLQVCPSPDVDTCMCGVQQFPGAKYMTMTGNHVILLTKLKDHDR